MNWVVIITLFVSLALNVLFAVLVSTQSLKGFYFLNESHARTVDYNKDLLDRLMAMDYSTYRAYQLEGPDEEPEEELVPVPVLGPDRGGFASKLGLSAYRPPEEDEIRPEEELP